MALFAVGFGIVFCVAAARQRERTKGTHKLLRVPFLAESSDGPAHNDFATASAHGAALHVVVCLTEGLASVFEESRIHQRLVAKVALEMLWMPLRAQGRNAVSTHWLTAASTFGSEYVVEISLAVGSAIALEKHAVFKGTEALCADEVFRVPFLANGRDTTVSDGLVAVSALGAAHLLVASLAGGSIVVLEKQPRSDRAAAGAARKMLRMVSIS